MVRLAVFLGNPGGDYARTRHNAGWMVCEALSFADSLVWQRKFSGMVASTGSLILLKPETLMNRSGESVGACARYFRLGVEDLIVVHDDIELPFGEVVVKSGGGLGGHRGLRDIVRVLGSGDFYRLRIGVSRPPHGEVASYVLSRFSKEEEADIPALLAKAARELESFLSR